MVVIPIRPDTPALPLHGAIPRGALADRSNDTLTAAMMQIVRSTCLALAILGAHANIAHAAGANLAWNACLPEGGAANRDFACNSNTGTNVLYGSFVLAADQPLCTGIEATVEISASADSLPSWWQLFNFGACRRTSLSTSFDFSSDPGTSCTDMWQGAGVGGIGAYHTFWTTPQVSSGIASQASIRFGAAVPIDSPMQLTAGMEYYAFKLMVNNLKTSGSGSCSGCSTPVCILLSELNVVQSDNQHEALTVAQTSNRVTWQGASNCPGAMRRRTSHGVGSSAFCDETSADHPGLRPDDLDEEDSHDPPHSFCDTGVVTARPTFPRDPAPLG